MKRILAMAVSVALIAVMAIGGTVAYFTDTDEIINVMDVGNINIRQDEKEREADNTLGDFENDELLMPSSYFANGEKPEGEPFGSMELWPNSTGAIDKLVNVVNEGESPAYVRTIFAFENSNDVDGRGLIIKRVNENVTDGEWKDLDLDVTIDGQEYRLYSYTYAKPLEKDATAPYSLMQFAMAGEAGNDDSTAIDGEYRILAFTQAVQSENMGSITGTNTGVAAATAALDAAFGNAPISETNHPWLNDTGIAPVYVLSAAELQSQLDAATDDITIRLSRDIKGDVKVTQKADVDVVIDGQNYKFDGVLTVFGDAHYEGAETLMIKNVKFVAKEGAESCIVSPDRAVNNRYSYAHNVTVDNCSFNDPDGTVNCAAIRHEDGGDVNWIVKNCTVDSTMHSFLQVNNVKDKLTIDKCIVKSKNGANLNSCTNVEMTNCEFDVKGYTVRFGVGTGGEPNAKKNFVIKDSTLKSACNDGDALIMFRASAANENTTLTLKKTTLDGTTHFSGADSIKVIEN